MGFNSGYEKNSKITFAILGIIFFIAYSWFSFGILQGGTVKFNSPYDTSSYFFITQFIKEKKIGYYEPYLALSNNLAHPRSMSEYGGFVVPTIFLGFLIILGTIGFIVGPYGILFIVPAVAALTPYFFYTLLIRFFSRRVALLSAILLFIHPAYWYYASRSMLPNVLLVDSVIIGLSFFAAGFEKKNYWYAAVCGLCIGGALSIRPTEAIWILPLCIIGYWHVRKQVSGKSLAAFFTALLAMLAIYVYMNNITFGSPFSFGYKIESFSSSLVAGASGTSSFLHTLLSLLFPFGFHPRLVIHLFWNYAVMLQWWFVIPGLLGFLVFLPRLIQKKYTFVFLITSGWLLLSYGSFEFSENITRAITLGDSHVRYWLPVFILSLPYVSLFAIWVFSLLARILKNRAVIGFFVCCTVICLGFLSVRLVYWQTNESLIPILGNIRDYQKKSQAIQSLVPPHAVIFSPASDKIFFPERKAAGSFPKFAELSSLLPLLRSVPVYYYGLWGFEDIKRINKEYFNPIGFELRLVAQLDAKEKLFIVTSIKK